MKNDIDFIKWMCEKAGGFEYGDFNDITLVGSGWGASFNTNQYKMVLLPLLLQRAIEGINKESQKGVIFQNAYSVWIIDNGPDYYFRDNTEVIIDDDHNNFMCESVDDAKESALRYIYEAAPDES